MSQFEQSCVIPQRSGVGLKPQHFADIIPEAEFFSRAEIKPDSTSRQKSATTGDWPDIGWPDIGWFEVHAENYMGQGGVLHHNLAIIRDHYPLSIHGVGLSIGAMEPLDLNHLERLAQVCARYEPGLVSEHLAWSSHEGAYYNDLLPLPYNEQTLANVCRHIDQVQTRLKCQILLENPSTYVDFTTNTMTEIQFVAEIAKKTGCGLLLDVNNVYVSCTNHDRDCYKYLASFPLASVKEIHLGGHEQDTDDDGQPLLIDAHNKSVELEVWNLYRYVIQLAGSIPTLIEWDCDVPSWPVLHMEAQRAESIMNKLSRVPS